MGKSIQFFYFDLGNVLLTFDHGLACKQIGDLCELPQSRVREVVFESELQEQYESGEISSEEFFETFCNRMQVRPDFKRFCEAASAIFELNFPVVPIVTQLRSCGNRLGILSNTCPSHWDYVLNRPYTLLSKAFEHSILSYEVRCLKPQRGIYDLAIEKAECDPAEIFFVDDRPENVAGAVEAGIDAVVFTSAEQLIADLAARDAKFNI